MSSLDLAVLALLIAAVIWGARAGFFVQVGTYVGFVGGAFLGAFLAGKVASWASSPTTALFISLGAVVLLSTVFGSLGGWIGSHMLRLATRIRLGFVDTGLGALTAAVGMLAIVWLLAGALATVPQSGIGATIQSSTIVRWIDGVMPPVPNVAARLSRLTDPLGFPRVFAGLEPSPAPPVSGPAPAQVQAAVDAAGRSTVQLRGNGCGGILFGSGWVAGTDIVVTNAHVIAGIAAPVVHDANGDHRATPIVFDPDADVAVLRVSGLAGRPLSLVPQDVGRGALGAVLGYPGGGPFTASAAAARDVYDALGRDIYGAGLVRRPVAELQADVRPGNSGGPFVLADGRVGGMVFARSVSSAGVGYALAVSTLHRELARAATASVPVQTGSCAAA
jgi:Trypsin-like serine proteases, typically periplasmic, contain C-terminal PDZ domain